LRPIITDDAAAEEWLVRVKLFELPRRRKSAKPGEGNFPKTIDPERRNIHTDVEHGGMRSESVDTREISYY
jgi:hypothetical protein